MDASQYKDYILTLLFVKYVTDKAKADPDSLIDVPAGGSFDDMLASKGKAEIGEKINKIIDKLAEANDLQKVIDLSPTSTTKRSSARARRCRTGCPSWSRSSTTSTSAAAAPRATTCSATPTST